MKIAQIAPLYESVPPKYYGGTERVVSYLTNALVEIGHDVTLFASGDSMTKANLVPICHRSLRLDKNCCDRLSHHVLMIEKVYQMADEFDIIHNHNDYLTYILARKCPVPTVTTLHGRLDIDDLIPLYKEFHDMALVSISDSQREPLAEANWIGTIHHGLPGDLYQFHPEKGEYLAFIGRISPEKRVDSAIEIAKEVGVPLKIAAKVDRVDEEYFKTVVEPLMKDPLIEYIGEIGEGEKGNFLGNAFALIFPIDWPEPFGLCMIEAMACGTPVIARRRGAVKEVIHEGENGFIVETNEQAVEAVKQLQNISRQQCRHIFERRFTDIRMAHEYVQLYSKLVDNKKVKECYQAINHSQ